MRPATSTGNSRGPVGPGPQACSRKARLPQRENDDDAAPTSADIGQTRARSVRGPNAPLPCAKSERGRRRLPSSPEAELRDAKPCGVAPTPPAQHPPSPAVSLRPSTMPTHCRLPAQILRAPVVTVFLLSSSVAADLTRSRTWSRPSSPPTRRAWPIRPETPGEWLSESRATSRCAFWSAYTGGLATGVRAPLDHCRVWRDGGGAPEHKGWATVPHAARLAPWQRPPSLPRAPRAKPPAPRRPPSEATLSNVS